MKKMKKFIMGFLIFISLIFIACENIEHEYLYDENMVNYVNTEYSGGIIYYELSVNKPTPCHELEYDARVSAVDVLEIFVEIVDMGDMCAQVITPEIIEGQIDAIKQPIRTIVLIN